jgi:hypothetical protein
LDVGSATTTHSSRGSRPRWPPHTVPCGNLALQPAPLPERSRQRRAPLAAVRPAWSVGCSLPPEHTPAQARRRRSPAGLHTTSAAVPASIPHSGRRPSRRGGGRTTCNSTRSSRDRCRPYRGVPHRHPGTRDETDATGRTDRHQTAGRRTGWTPAGRTAASGRGSQMIGHWTGWTPDGWTPGPRTADRVGWTPRWTQTGDGQQVSWHPDHGDEDPTAGMLSSSSAGLTPLGAISSPGQLSRRTLPSPGYRRDQSAAG